MRDPARIDEVLDVLGAYWRAHPDLRLGQIVSNATPDRFRWETEIADNYTQVGPRDPFHVEDDIMLEGIRNLR